MLRRVVEGISELSEGVLLGERYRLACRLELFSAGAERIPGVEYEYWLAVDVATEDEVWIQFAASDGRYAPGSSLAGAVAALRSVEHPAIPSVEAIGEYEFEREGVVASVGYCAIPAAAGETLAAALLRGELDRAEILAALGQLAEVFELLAEYELVHGHLSAHSVLLNAIEGNGYEVVLADLPASLALETALESELTAAADVYALAWLTVLALAGPEVLETEFGSGFAATTEFEFALQAEEVVNRRLVWAGESLVVLGVSAELAEVLLLALGEAAARPRAAELTAALRAEWVRHAGGGGADVAGSLADEITEAVAGVEVAAVGEAAAAGESGEVEETGEVAEVGGPAPVSRASGHVGPTVRAESPSTATAGGATRTNSARRPHPGMLVGGGVTLVIVIVLIIALSSGPSKSANAATSGSVSTAGASASNSASAHASGSASASASGSASTGASAAGSASSTGGGASPLSATPTSPAGAGFTFPAALETGPATARQAVQEIQAAANEAKGELSGAEQGQLSQIISTLNQEIASGQTLSTGLAQLWGLLHSGELPSSLNTYLIQLATYLSASQGS